MFVQFKLVIYLVHLTFNFHFFFKIDTFILLAAIYCVQSISKNYKFFQFSNFIHQWNEECGFVYISNLFALTAVINHNHTTSICYFLLSLSLSLTHHSITWAHMPFSQYFFGESIRFIRNHEKCAFQDRQSKQHRGCFSGQFSDKPNYLVHSGKSPKKVDKQQKKMELIQNPVWSGKKNTLYKYGVICFLHWASVKC